MKRWILAALLFLCSSNLDLAGAQQKTADAKIIIGLARTSMSMLPVFLAQDKGLFREEGLEPQLVFVGGRLQVRALAAGEVDYSASAETVLRPAVQGCRLKSRLYEFANGGFIDCSARYQNGFGTKRPLHRSDFDRRQSGLCGA
jgi:ABC-type nitrate/sulfonate/bicarbonate transport system substrate-binding protein